MRKETRTAQPSHEPIAHAWPEGAGNDDGGIGRPRVQRPLLMAESRLTLLFYTLFLGALGLSHWRPQNAFPEEGLYVAGALGLTLALALALAGSLQVLRALLCWPVALFLALLAWSVFTFAWSVYPAEGIDTVGGWLEGYWVLCASLLGWRAVCAAEREMKVESSAAAPVEGGVALPRFSIAPRQMAVFAVFAFFAVVSIASATKGIYQYFFGFAQQLSEFERSGAARQGPLADGIRHALLEKRTPAWYGNPNVLCYILAMGLPFVLGLMGARRRFWSRTLWAMGLLAIAMAMYFTKSRGGWLCALVAVAAAGVVMGREQCKRLAVPVVFVGALAVAVWLLFAFIGPYHRMAPSAATASPATAAPREQQEVSFWKRLTRVSTIQERLHYLAAATRQLRLSPLSPLIGNGIGSYGVLYLQTVSPGAREARDVHNAPVQLWVEGGAPAAGLMIALYAVALAAGLRGGRWRRADETLGLAATRMATGMATAALFVFGLSALIDIAFFFSREFFLDGCLLMGWLVAMRQETAVAAPLAPRNKGWQRLLASRKAGWALLALWMAANVAGGWVFLGQPMRARAAFLSGEDLAADARGALMSSEELAAKGRRAEAQEQRQIALGELAEALEQYQLASSVQGNNARYLDAQAGVTDELGRPEDALRLRAQAMALNPYSAAMIRAQATLLLRLKRPQEALATAERAIGAYPLNPEGYAVKARLLTALGRGKEAVACLEKAAQLEPHEPEKYVKEREAILGGTGR